jgi:hypothetical protein
LDLLSELRVEKFDNTRMTKNGLVDTELIKIYAAEENISLAHFPSYEEHRDF